MELQGLIVVLMILDMTWRRYNAFYIVPRFFVLTILPRITQGFSSLHHVSFIANDSGRRNKYYSSTSDNHPASIVNKKDFYCDLPSDLLIVWKGEDSEGYSRSLRHAEFRGALEATSYRNSDICLNHNNAANFENALHYTGSTLSPLKVKIYNESLQYVYTSGYSIQSCVEAVQRCSLVHDLYKIVASTTDIENVDKFDVLAKIALENKAFFDISCGQENEKFTWSLRLRTFRQNFDQSKGNRYSERARSVSQEREAILGLEPLLITFGGKVNLDSPDCRLVIFDGLKDGRTVLARHIARGPSVTSLNPNTRICVTNTPLCPIAAFSMCNIGALRANQSVLDPFSGSCAILLAAAMIEPTCRTVGIEIAPSYIIRRENILKDFSSRSLTPPMALIEGNSNDSAVRDHARSAIGGESFDLIITDPPYGIRETTKNSVEVRPIDALLDAITVDRHRGVPLLRKNGRLVVFLPCRVQEDGFDNFMPTDQQMKAAGIRFELMREQYLNDSLSRWLVSFVCVN
jgi:tRNA G10  N-methylase Trm11